MSDAEYRKLVHKAKAKGMNVSEYLRWIAIPRED
jgi:hypothetical protein